MNHVSRRTFALLELSQCIKPSVGLLHYVAKINFCARRTGQLQLLDEVEQLAILGRVSRRSIIDLLATDKSRYFAITEYNNCFVIRSPSLFF